MWGTWWVWDARLTSELILFFLYLGHIALTNAIDDPRRADKAGGILALVGALNVPVIYFSVKWWNTLHQGASVSLTKGSSMAQVMLEAMLIMGLAFWMYAVAMALYRVRSIILVRERHTQWVAELPEVKSQMLKNAAGGSKA
jgi:heme exporter protein C